MRIIINYFPSSHVLRRVLVANLYLWSILWIPTANAITPVNDIETSDSPLPVLGDRVSGVVSPSMERQLGTQWLRALRSQITVIQDPLLNEYTNDLIRDIATFVDSETLKTDLVIINNASINAFAVPGGIVGIHAGLFLHAESESELAAVIAHELAHLTQRHFARSVERMQQTQWTVLAAMLTGIALIAAGNDDSGLAALATTQAASMDSQLRFSRQNEMEADRIGMHYLNEAQFDATAMPRFFERMMRANQFSSSNRYEFLQTHPVTENRIADSISRAEQLYAPNPLKVQNSLDFRLMQTRVRAGFMETPAASLAYFKNQQSKARTDEQKIVAQYGIVRALIAYRSLPEALKTIQQLRRADPQRLTYVITEAEVLMAQKNYSAASTLLSEHLILHPGSYPISMELAKSLIEQNKAVDTIDMLEALVRKNPRNPYIWELLIQSYGQTNNTIDTYLAKAELDFLYHRNEQAIQQLNYALAKLDENQMIQRSKIEASIKQMNRENRELNF